MKKITRLSRILKLTAILACITLPLSEAGYWITSGYPFLDPFFKTTPLPSFGTTMHWQELTSLQRFLGFLISMIPLAFSMASLAYLSKLFGSFERLSLFEKENTKILQKAGWALVLGQIVYPFYMAALSITLTYRNPVGQRNISIGFGGAQLEILAIGLSILLVSWIFGEAVKLQEEQAAVV